MDAASPLVDAGPATRADAGSPPSGCADPPPDDDACLRGDGWRACGGDGPPRFACAPGTFECAWFEDGCVPTAWIASPCPAEELCCIDGGAFAPDALESEDRERANLYLELFGLEPPDRDALARVDVVVDPALAVGPEPVLACGGEEHALCQEPDPSRPLGGGADRTDDTLSVWGLPFQTVGLMPRLLVEVRPEDPTRASACIAWTSDAIGLACPTTPPPRCADSGTLSVSAVPPPRSGIAAIAARLVARFGDLEVTLEVPPP